MEDKINGTQIELIRRIIIAAAIIIGIMCIGYVTPAVISLEWVDFKLEQEKQLEPTYGYLSDEDKRLGNLPLQEYIDEMTEGKTVELNTKEWGNFFNQVYLASSGQYADSDYGDRVSEKDKEWYFSPGEKNVKVFFKPSELPAESWGLNKNLNSTYLNIESQGNKYYIEAYYRSFLDPVDRFYITPPTNMYHPWRTIGIIILIAGLILGFALPRKKPELEDVYYQTGPMIAGDMVGVMFLGLFFTLPIGINEGTIQAVTHWWGLTLVFMPFVFAALYILYINGWHASYRLRFRPDSIARVTFRGIEQYRYMDISSVEEVVLVYPKWFLWMFRIVMLFALLSGKGATTSTAGPYLLSESASYAGLAVNRRDGRPLYIWYGNQMGNVILPGYERVIEECRQHGIVYNDEPQVVRGFMYMK